MSAKTPNFNTPIPDKILTPDRVATRLGELESSTACLRMPRQLARVLTSCSAERVIWMSQSGMEGRVDDPHQSGSPSPDASILNRHMWGLGVGAIDHLQPKSIGDKDDPDGNEHRQRGFRRGAKSDAAICDGNIDGHDNDRHHHHDEAAP